VTVDEFLPVATTVAAVAVLMLAVYAVCYSIHVWIIAKLGVSATWPLRGAYTAGIVIGSTCAVLAYLQRGTSYGFHGDKLDDDLFSLYILGALLSGILLVSAGRAASAAAKAASKK
jgi:hypothetical protein